MVAEVLLHQQPGEPQAPLQLHQVLDVVVYRKEGRGDDYDDYVPVDGVVERGLVLLAQRGHHVPLDVREHHHEPRGERAEHQHYPEQDPGSNFLVAVVIYPCELDCAEERGPKLSLFAVHDLVVLHRRLLDPGQGLTGLRTLGAVVGAHRDGL